MDNSDTSFGRTFAYSAGVLSASVLSIITSLLLIPDTHYEPITTAWETINHLTSKLFPCLLLPLLIVLPPVFQNRNHRALATIVLCILGILLQAVHVMSTVRWVAQAEKDVMMMRAPELVLALVIAVLLAGLLIFVLVITHQTWREGKPANIVVDNRQVGKCVSFGDSKMVMILYFHYRQLKLDKLHN